ncbi:MFS transporter, DHA2 family, methylenomycin A resistance protein [Marmoricola sp. URHA0025 HA25]
MGTSGPSTTQRRTPADRPVARRGLLLVVMCVGYFLVLLDVTVVNVALPRIGEGLGAGVAGLQWVVDGYALALAVLLLAGGTVGDGLGHRRVVLSGMAVFGLASAACVVAPTTGVLIAARVGQGVGAALLLPGTLAIISRAYPQRSEQARAIGVWAGVGSVALPAGPLLGGVLVDGAGWRWVFLVNVPVVLVAFIVSARLVPRDHGARDRRLDVTGTVLGAATLAAATFAVIELGRTGPDLGVLAAAAAALAGGVCFVLTERRVGQPMLPLSLFGNRPFSVANAVAGSMNLCTLGLLFVLTLYLQHVQGRSALDAGVAVLPLFLPLVVLPPLVGAVISARGPRLPAVVGLAFSAVGVGLLTTWSTDTSYARIVPALLCWGIGIGILTPAVVAAAIGAVTPDRSGLASGVNNTARQAGGAIGIAAYGAVAGTPAKAVPFLHGLHVAAAVTVAVWALAALASARWLPHTPRRRS